MKSKSRILTSEITVNSDIETVFSFFAQAENLNIITPPELKFRIITPLPIEMKKGTLIDYKIKLNAVPFAWKTEISEWEPPFRFIDRQIKGPYKLWIHEHTFRSHDGKTVVKDTVEYLPPGNIAEPFIHKLVVQKKLERIFSYRRQKIKEIFNK